MGHLEAPADATNIAMRPLHAKIDRTRTKVHPMTTLAKALDELKPCPFCGRIASYREHAFPLVFCDNDECFGPQTTAADFENAVRQWNTRSLDALRGREEIARIIDPELFEKYDIELKFGRFAANGKNWAEVCYRDRIDKILAKADAILALPPATPRPVEIEEVTAGQEGVRGADPACMRAVASNMPCVPAVTDIMRCAICGFVVGTSFKAEKPSIDFTMAGRSKSALPPAPADGVRVSIKPMQLSDNRMDYFVSIKVGDREVTPHVFREEFKAAYHVALYDWLLNGSGEEPDVVEFGPDDWPALAALPQDTADRTGVERPAAFLQWARETFGPVALLRSERLLRFVEEAIELAHAEGMERVVFDRVADRVYSRPAGDTPKEIGQAQACLETFAESIGFSSNAETQREWERVQKIPHSEWEARHAAKQALGIALSVDTPARPLPPNPEGEKP